MKELQISKNKYIWFGKKAFSWKPYYITNDASRFVDDEKVIAIGWLWFCFQIVTENYADLIHIYIDPTKKYSKNVKIFIGILEKMWNNYNCPYWKTNLQFIFNYVKGKYYITGKRNWFLTHHLGSLLQYTYPELYMDDEEMKNFPKNIF
jgi:hypothetical protein